MVLQLLSDGGVVRIVPENEATRDSNESLSQSSIETKIFTLKNRAAGEISQSNQTYHWKAISSVKHPID